MWAFAAPLRDTARNTAGVLVVVAATVTAIVVLWGFVIRAGKTRPGRWMSRRIMAPLRRAFIEERRDQKRAEANARILKVVETAIAPVAAKVAEIAHSTNGKLAGQPTMSAEITALTGSVDKIVDGLDSHRARFEEVIGEQLTPRLSALEASQKVVAALVADLTVRVAALERSPHDPHPPVATPDQGQHRRRDD